MPDDRRGQVPRRALSARQLRRAGTAPQSRQAGTAPQSRQAGTARQLRRKRFAAAVTGVASAMTLLVAATAWSLTSYVNSSLGRVNAGTSGTPASGPVNILVVGVDTRGGLTHHQEVALHVGNAISTNTDTMMLMHIPADHDSVQVVSLPRDSWVDIPGHGMNKINAAYGIGGPQLMVRTVEHATGLVINDYVEIDFLGFVKVINALGGVDVCLPFAVDDHYSGLRLSAGRHHVNGATALKFVRDRHSFALSDLARIKDQQQLLSSALSKATRIGLLANPIRLQEFLSSVSAAVTVDQGFNLIRLAEELRGIRPSDVTFTTVPLATMNYRTPTGELAVLWSRSRAAALFRRLKEDAGTAPPRRTHRSGGAHSPGHSRRPTGRPSAPSTNHHRVSGKAVSGHTRTAASGPGRTAAQDACH